ncbi:Putative solute carrier organic anion transporter family member 1B7 [Gossypium arboreum]|uniref:Putative solute carrier organic anion transporter family member 1B7 n=1 Tax=Gossypium arboreum TaxID=29729 RepID=A0A0B0PQ37_GOSAR|nr:Putative solute carrier organic anion transporter family member 1B7 [Gossypium arboreum]
MVLHVNLKSMPMSQMWSYTKTHIGILCHDIGVLIIPMVRTGLFGHRYLIETFSISHIHLL